MPDQPSEPEGDARRAEVIFRAITQAADQIGVGVSIAYAETPEPEMVYVSEGTSRICGWSTTEMMSRPVWSFLAPEELPRLMELHMRRLGGEPTPIAETVIVRKDGSRVPVEFSTSAITLDGRAANVTFLFDITERKRVEVALRESEARFAKKLTEADKLAAVGALAAGVAHEINNPLAYVLLNLEFVLRELRAGAPPPRVDIVRQRLEDAKQGAERVKIIVRDLQALTRKDEDIRGPVELPPVIEAALHMARHEISQRARIVRRFESVPPVHGNATRFEQTFLNLLVNAAHALDRSDPEWDVIEVALKAGPDHTVVAEVRDTGSGMSSDVLARAFEPFFTTKPMGVGTGLGLPICRGIVEAVGGEITLESEPGRGTVARVVLREHGPGFVTSPPPERGAGSEPPPRTRGRVLIVDDEPAVALSLSHELGRRHEVQVARSADEARAALASGMRFDAVLCDLVMPGETGMAFYEEVLATRPDLAERFVFMTGGAFLPDAAEFLATAGRPYLEKPFDLPALRRIVDRVAGLV